MCDVTGRFLYDLTIPKEKRQKMTTRIARVILIGFALDHIEATGCSCSSDATMYDEVHAVIQHLYGAWKSSDLALGSFDHYVVDIISRHRGCLSSIKKSVALPYHDIDAFVEAKTQELYRVTQMTAPSDVRDPSLKCNKCGRFSVSRMAVQTRAGDEDQSEQMVCLVCGHKRFIR